MADIDHTAEARKHIDWVHEWQSYEGDTPEANLANAGIAQAHATLALVEQQRIANEQIAGVIAHVLGTENRL